MLNKVLTKLSIFFIKLYQLILSPDKGIPSIRLKGKVCRHKPHCSAYAVEHLQKHGFLKSIFPIFERVSNCTPGYEIIDDPVPKTLGKIKKV